MANIRRILILIFVISSKCTCGNEFSGCGITHIDPKTQIQVWPWIVKVYHKLNYLGGGTLGNISS